ncbi:MAG: hypothetical protein UY62_C0026G0007 [Parcubacteria group bacterium GW2011_GWF2_50_9]|nr:MAG: hypothetical protein UY62_C0026G0007 [Parcubacteria group bacterium GW2011_GWF2_50_9]
MTNKAARQFAEAFTAGYIHPLNPDITEAERILGKKFRINRLKSISNPKATVSVHSVS